MLNHIQILDFTQYLPGPYATVRFVDRGAKVIKVESPDGDPSRFPLETDNDAKYIFRANNRGKKSIVLNLKDNYDQKIAHELIKQSDVIIEGFRPGVAARLGISYDKAVQLKSDIIYCSITGYGQEGELRDFGSHDLNYLAISGMLDQLKDDRGKPIQPSHTLADLVGGLAVSEAILAALYERERTGKGKFIDLSLADVMLTLMTNHITLHSATGYQHGIEKLNKSLVCYYIYETYDGRYVSLCALEEKFWRNFCNAINKPEWLSAHLSPANESNRIFQEMKQLFLSKTFNEWVEFSKAVDCCMAPVLKVGEVYDYPVYKDKNLIVQHGGIRYVKMNNEERSSFISHPQLGEHHHEIVNGINLLKNKR